MSRFANLEKACGGSISIEALEEFEKAMAEYRVFMKGMGEMMAPVEFEVAGRRFKSRQFAEAYASRLFKEEGVVAGIEKVSA